MAYPKLDDTQRPIRIWDEVGKKNVPYRYYVHVESAHVGAFKDIRWGKLGDTITVYNILTGRPHSSYGLRVYPEDWPVVEQRGKLHIAIIDHSKLPPRK